MVPGLVGVQVSCTATVDSAGTASGGRGWMAMPWGGLQHRSCLMTCCGVWRWCVRAHLVAGGGVVDEQACSGWLADMGGAQVDPWCLRDGVCWCWGCMSLSYVAKWDQ